MILLKLMLFISFIYFLTIFKFKVAATLLVVRSNLSEFKIVDSKYFILFSYFYFLFLYFLFWKLRIRIRVML